ncbi:MAG: isoprenylcysteine carboxylmethyltransferase family protein [Verrucomicrobiaceae bacterium]|nr:isoprenylcysteine carboxylmethyltransferase family protein [Verrucomicrobiaceae bacterium]
MSENSTPHGSQDSFMARGGLWVVIQFVLMVALLFAAPMSDESFPNNEMTQTIAALMLTIGAWCGIRGVRDLGQQRTALPKPLPGGQLVTTGVYALVRHPLYASLIWLGFGWGLLFGSALTLGIALIQLVFLDLKARREECWLRDHFAGYPDYAARVKRFIPGVY